MSNNEDGELLQIKHKAVWFLGDTAIAIQMALKVYTS